MTLANFGVCDQPKQEIEFFNLIKSNCEVIFDVGCREDADYLENSLDKSREFHMFDPNVAFLEKCESKLGGLEAPEGVENSVYFNAIGLGDVEGEMTYYSNTQSFVFRTHHTRSAPSSLSFPVKTIKSYCSEREVDRIDFLKIDTEGYEYEILLGLKEKLTKVKLLMFEHHYDNMIKKNYLYADIKNLLKKYNFEMIFKAKMPLRKTFEYIFINTSGL